jgi:hypothetical protein
MFCEGCRDGYTPSCAECKRADVTKYEDGSAGQVHSTISFMESGLQLFKE